MSHTRRDNVPIDADDVGAEAALEDEHPEGLDAFEKARATIQKRATQLTKITAGARRRLQDGRPFLLTLCGKGGYDWTARGAGVRQEERPQEARLLADMFTALRRR